jgi:hypothetical protein
MSMAAAILRRFAQRWGALLLIPALLFACGPKDDAAAILAIIEKAAGHAQAHEIGKLMELTIPAFVAQPGGHDARSTRAILFAAFQHYGKFSIHFPRPEIRIGEGKNSAEAIVYFTIVSQDKALPGLKELYDDPRRWLEKASEIADLYQLKLALGKADGQWKAHQAHLEGFKGYGF